MFVFSDEEDNDAGTKKDTTAKDWKKNKGFVPEERLTMRIDAQKADMYAAKKKDNIQSVTPVQKVQPGLNKVNKKIRDIYDEEEDEDEWGVVIHKNSEEYDQSLMKTIDEDERKIYVQQQEIKNIEMLQTAGKMEAIAVVGKLASETGKNNLDKKDVAKEMMNATFNPEKAQQTILQKDIFKEKNIEGKTDIKNIRDVIQTARGIQKIEDITQQKSFEKMDIKDIKEAGKENVSNKKVAEIIIEKRGLKDEKAEQIRNNAKKKENTKINKGTWHNKTVEDCKHQHTHG